MYKYISVCFFLSMLFGTSLSVSAQFSYNNPYFLYSSNGEYFLKAIPHQPQIFETKGYMEVYQTIDSVLLYKTDFYLNPRHLVLSDDGTGILFKPIIYGLESDLGEYNLYYLKNGVIEKKTPLSKVVVDSMNFDHLFLLYYNSKLYHFVDGERIYFDTIPKSLQIANESKIFSNNNIAYLSLMDSTLVQIDLSTGNIISKSDLLESEDILTKAHKKRNIIFPEIENPGESFPPYMGDSATLRSIIESNFDYISDRWNKKGYYKYYSLSLEFLIDYTGRCVELKIDSEDTTWNESLKNFFLNYQFDSTKIPKIVEKWEFDDYESFRKTDSLLSVKERYQERKDDYDERIYREKQDSLNGLHIPKDLEDCMYALDELLDDKTKKEFSKGNPSDYHFGLGRYLRNNWGLWSSSRIKKYFVERGYNHPDNMSGVILDTYQQYLKDPDFDIEEIIEKYGLDKIIEKPKPPFPDRLKNNLKPQKLK